MAEPVPTPNAEVLVAEISKLCRHIAGLQRDVATLAARIAPFDDEYSIPAEGAPWSRYAELGLQRHKAPTFETFAVVIRQADYQLKDTEGYVRMIASKLTEIANDTYLRADLKEWVDQANETEPRRRR